MSNGAVAMCAVKFLFLVANRQNFMHKVGMAMQAILLHDPAAHISHLNRFMEILQRKTLRVPEAVFRLRVVLAQKIVRQMAIDAFGHTVVAGLLPSIILRLHDVTVDAGLRIRAKVREPFGILKCVQALAQSQTDDYGE